MADSDDPQRTAAFEGVLRDFGAGLMRVAMAYGADSAEAQDLYQEICYAIWQAMPTFRGDSTLRTFVWRIAHNRGLTFRSRRPSRSEDSQRLADLVDGGPPADQIVADRLRHEHLLSAIRQLSDTQREVVLLSLEGLTQAEIGAVLGIAENAVAVRLNRARARLRLALDPRRFDR